MSGNRRRDKSVTKMVPTDRLRGKQVAGRGPGGVADRVSFPEPAAVRRMVEAGKCPFCGRGPWASLAGHTSKTHGVDRFELREAAGMTWKTSITSDELRQRNSERGREFNERFRDVPRRREVGRRRYSEAGMAVQKAKLDAARSPEQRRAATAAAHTPEAKARRTESVRQAWADGRMGKRWACSECGGPKLAGRAAGAKTCSEACGTARRSKATKAVRAAKFWNSKPR